MFDLEKGTLTQAGKEFPIVKWEVWFSTPKGLTDDLETAIRVCQENDWGANGVIAPVPVALDSAGRYEIIMRG